jgi:hypothetical protein
MNAPRLPTSPEKKLRISGFIISAVSLALCAAFVYGTFVGIQRGVMHICIKYSRRLTFYRETEPEVFWIATTVNFGISAMFLYFSIRTFPSKIKPRNGDENEDT